MCVCPVFRVRGSCCVCDAGSCVWTPRQDRKDGPQRRLRTGPRDGGSLASDRRTGFEEGSEQALQKRAYEGSEGTVRTGHGEGSERALRTGREEPPVGLPGTRAV
eukprot:1279422-Prorocentrum_lima.AAC.1